MRSDYFSIQITADQAAETARELYQLQGDVIPLPGESDFNFRINCAEESYLLKISRPCANMDLIEFQVELLNYIAGSDLMIHAPKSQPDVNGKFIGQTIDASGNMRIVRLQSWIDGRLWSLINPKKETLVNSLGRQAGLLTKALLDFDHPTAHRPLEWDLAQSDWTFSYVHLFDERRQHIIKHFQQKFKKIADKYKAMRKSVVHSDVNDNNIIVSDDLVAPKVLAIIDFGDAVYTQTINDLAIAAAYAIMNSPDVLRMSLPLIKGYHSQYPLMEEELAVLYSLVAMRLIVSVTKSAINRRKEPDNEYLLISEKPAWDALEKWIQVDENLAHYCFRGMCGFTPHPNEKAYVSWVKNQPVSAIDLFKSLKIDKIIPVDMSVSSTWLGHESEYSDNHRLAAKLLKLQQRYPDALLAGGYLETRPLYFSDAFIKEGNNGPEYRSVHLGIDFWIDTGTPIHALFDGAVFSIFNNASDKDYGPTLILKHTTDDGISFFSLYGHLSKSTLELFQTGQHIQKGDLIGYVGDAHENGNWTPHLHYQLMLDLLGNKHNFPGVTFPKEAQTWMSICPDPNLIFREKELDILQSKEESATIDYRNKHLGKSLSLSYNKPLKIVRGSGAFLIDQDGRKYLDTVNNVAHVGHEHPRVIKAGQKQMAVLNTNTRYLHDNINEFAKELLATFPEKLSVAHFVNSGSEANDLALRMVRAYTGQQDMIAVEVGYHGNTNSCIDISSYKFDGKGGKGVPEHTHIVPLPDVYRGLYQGSNTGARYAAHVKEQIDKIQSKGRNLAGFICESIISCGGQVELPENYLKISYGAVRKAGGLCVADEVQVGCGRVGSKFWGFELHDVVPDIVTIGKPIGNGHPLSAVVCTREVADAFANGMEYFNTFGGNPVSCAIGREVLAVISSEKLQENALIVGNYMKTGLWKLQKGFPFIGDVRGQGLFLGFELVDENKLPLGDKADYLANRMKELGILMSTDGKDNNVLKIKPPMVFSKNNADELLFRLKAVLAEDFM